MIVARLPAAPETLPPEPRAFYEALRTALEGVTLEAEVDFGDGGVGLAFRDGIGAQVSRRAAVVFAGAAAEHYDERTPGWTDAAAAALARLLSR